MQFSPLALGLWRIADTPRLSPQAVVTLVETALDLGITTMDQADIYGNYSSEALFGEALQQAPGLRQRMQLVTKCGIKLRSDQRPEHQIKYYDTGAAHVRASVEHSLRQMHTDHIDLLLIHRPDPLMDADELAATFEALHASGKVLHFGVSNFSPAQLQLLQSRLSMKLQTNQIEINPMHLTPFTDGSLDYLYEHNITPMAWSPFGGGALFSSDSPQLKRIHTVASRLAEQYGLKGIDQVILAWLRQHPAGIVPVLGTTKPRRVQAAAQALETRFTREEWYEIWTASTGVEVP